MPVHTDAERMFCSTWFTEELKKAEEKGYRILMADKTTLKTLPGREHVCRCSNLDVTSNPIDLFEEKAKAEKLLSYLEINTGLIFVAGDEFPTYICRNCFNLVRQFSKFHNLCIKSRLKQEASVRLKQGKKVTESPSTAELREAKRVKADTATQRGLSSSVIRKSLQMGPGNTPTLPIRGSDEAPVQKRVRILPKPLQPASVVEPSQEVLILAKTSIRNSEVHSEIYKMLINERFAISFCYE